MKNIISLFIGGPEMKISPLQELPFLSKAKILVEKEIGAEIGKRKLPVKEFNLLKVDFVVTETIESTLWDILNNLRKIKSGLKENLVQGITFLIHVCDDDFIDFAITKKMFSIYTGIKVIFKFCVEISKTITIEIEDPALKQTQTKSRNVGHRKELFAYTGKISSAEFITLMQEYSIKNIIVKPPTVQATKTRHKGKKKHS